MPTVAQLQTEAANIASLNTSNATEAALILGWLNDAYLRAVGLTGAFDMDVSVSPSAGTETILRSDYTPATTVGQGVHRVRDIWLNGQSTGSGTGRRLMREAVEDVIGKRAADTVAPYDGPLMYAIRGNGDIELWPVTSNGNTLTLEIDSRPKELVASGATTSQETTPTAIDAVFHRTILLNYAVAMALRYRGLETRSQFFMGEHERGMKELSEWLNEQGGIMGTPIRVRRRRDVGEIRYPDQVR